MTKTMTALPCKAKFMALVDEVAETGESIIVTRNGKPVGRIEPHVPDAQGILAARTRKAPLKSR